MRTSVAPLLDRDLEIAAHAHRQIRQLQPGARTEVIAEPPQFRERRAGILRVVANTRPSS